MRPRPEKGNIWPRGGRHEEGGKAKGKVQVHPAPLAEAG
jgi:hypothetical protein